MQASFLVVLIFKQLAAHIKALLLWYQVYGGWTGNLPGRRRITWMSIRSCTLTSWWGNQPTNQPRPHTTGSRLEGGREGEGFGIMARNSGQLNGCNIVCTQTKDYLLIEWINSWLSIMMHNFINFNKARQNSSPPACFFRISQNFQISDLLTKWMYSWPHPLVLWAWLSRSLASSTRSSS